MIVVVGVSHHDAPIEIRERLSVDREALPRILADLRAQPAVGEVACLSTCNRTEVYAVPIASDEERMAQASRQIIQVLAMHAEKNGASGLASKLQSRTGKGALLHLFRVTSSLDSLVIGEPQIQGQVKEAFESARDAGTLGPTLERAFSRALHVAKKVRTETAVGSGQVSVSSVAIDLAKQIFGELAGRTCLLIGAGEMAEASAKLLIRGGAKIVVVNRSLERGQALATEFGGLFRPFTELEGALTDADVVIASTAAREFILTRPMMTRVMRGRRGRSLFLIDIAVPRDIDPAVNRLDNLYLYDVDDLSKIVADSMRGRVAEAERAELLVDQEAERFASWAEGLRANASIVALRTKVRASMLAELERSLAGKLRHLPDADKKSLAIMMDAALSKILHAPTTRMKALSPGEQADMYLEVIHHLFDLPAPHSSQLGSREPQESSGEGENSSRMATSSSPTDVGIATDPMPEDTLTDDTIAERHDAPDLRRAAT